MSCGNDSLRRRQMIVVAAVGAATLIVALVVPDTYLRYLSFLGMLAAMGVFVLLGIGVMRISGRRSGKKKKTDDGNA